jgi:hypothetical protein
MYSNLEDDGFDTKGDGNSSNNQCERYCPSAKASASDLSPNPGGCWEPLREAHSLLRTRNCCCCSNLQAAQ